MKKQAAVHQLTPPLTLSEQSFAPEAIGVTQGLEPKSVIDLSVECSLSHIVQHDSYAFDRELQIAQDMVQNPEAFFKDPLALIFGPEKETPAANYSHRCSSEQNKKQIMGELQEFLEGLSGTRAVRDDALMAADELYTNGAKNSGKLYLACDNEELNPGWVEFVARADNERLVLGCIDSYGALELTMITKRIQKCFADGVAQSISQDQAGGAGIGSYMVFSAAISMYVGVLEGEKTIVLCSFPMGMRMKDLMGLTKNFHSVMVKKQK